MTWILTKYAVTAAIVVAVSEAAKRSPKLGGLLGALPWVTLLALVWLHVEREPADKLTGLAEYTFWYVVPTLPMFLAFPRLLPRLGFWPTLFACAALTAACFALLAVLARRFGVDLL